MQKKTLVLAIGALFTVQSPLHAAPEGGQVVAGQASIQRQGNDTRITQSSDRAIVNWQRFDIGKTEKVEHTMPSAASYGLHRVIGGGGASQLAGELKSNGNVFLVNPAGVVIHKGARIDVGGFLASTADIKNDDFMAGKLLFNRPGNPGAAIINLGNISVSDRGFAALVAPTVRNDGIVAARLGRITLASGDGFKLDFYGDDLITFAAPETLVDGFYTPEGETLGVTNNGEIKAEGGIVYLTASQLDSIVQSVVQNGGTVSAASAELDGGKIILKAEGEVRVAGTLDASSGKGNGGFIDVSGKAGTTVENARITTAGKTKGLVRLGGEFQGGGNKAGATELRENFVDRFGTTEKLASTAALTVTNSTIDAGKDGTLIAWSNGNTVIDGELVGKYVETSGKNLSVTDAPQGKGGVWLIDPDDLTISESSTGTTIPDVNANSLKASAIASYLNQTSFQYPVSLSIQANKSINVQSDIIYGIGYFSLSAPDISIANGVTIGSEENLNPSSSFTLSLYASNKLTLYSGNLYADYVGIKAKETLVVAGTIKGREISFLGENLDIDRGLMEATAHLNFWGTQDSSEAVNQGFKSVVLNGATLKSAGTVEVYVDDLTLRNGSLIEADTIKIAGGRRGGPSEGCKSDSCYYGIYELNKYTSSINFEEGKIKSNRGIELKVGNILVNSVYEDTIILSEEIVSLDTNATITLPSGTKTTPRIKTGIIHFGYGAFVLGEYAVEAEEVNVGDKSVSLTGQGNSGNPHIFGLESFGLEDYSSISLESASNLYPTLVLQDVDGKIYKNGEDYSELEQKILEELGLSIEINDKNYALWKNILDAPDDLANFTNKHWVTVLDSYLGQWGLSAEYFKELGWAEGARENFVDFLGNWVPQILEALAQSNMPGRKGNFKSFLYWLSDGKALNIQGVLKEFGKDAVKGAAIRLSRVLLENFARDIVEIPPIDKIDLGSSPAEYLSSYGITVMFDLMESTVNGGGMIGFAITSAFSARDVIVDSTTQYLNVLEPLGEEVFQAVLGFSTTKSLLQLEKAKENPNSDRIATLERSLSGYEGLFEDTQVYAALGCPVVCRLPGNNIGPIISGGLNNLSNISYAVLSGNKELAQQIYWDTYNELASEIAKDPSYKDVLEKLMGVLVQLYPK
jgi:filamentous hemagglutinin family protein